MDEHLLSFVSSFFVIEYQKYKFHKLIDVQFKLSKNDVFKWHERYVLYIHYTTYHMYICMCGWKFRLEKSEVKAKTKSVYMNKLDV